METVRSDAKVLAVGAGGIGCELLKVLVQSAFKQIEVVRRNCLQLTQFGPS